MSSANTIAPEGEAIDGADAATSCPADAGIDDGRERRSLRSLLLPDAKTAGLISLITVLAYLPTMLGAYGISDDLFDLLTSTRDNTSLPHVAISGGRPLSGLVQEFALSLATDVASLRWLRVVGVLGLVATGIIGATIARWFGARTTAQVLVGLGIVAMPSSQVIASWAVLFPISWGAALALATGFGLAALTVDSVRTRAWWIAVGTVAVMTVIGLSNYQPSAMAFAPGLAVALMDSAETIRVRVHRAAAGIAGAAMGGVVYLVLSGILVRATGVTADTRSTLEIPGADKLHWFVTKVLPRSLDPLSFEPRPAVAIIVLGLIIVGVAVRADGTRDRVLAAALVLIALVVAYLPTLMVQDRWPSARSRLAVDLTVALFAGIALQTLLTRVRHREGAARAVLAVWATSMAFFVIFASWRVTTYYVDPQTREFAAASRAIDALHLQPGDSVVVVAADWRYPLARTHDLDEFGFPSMATAWGPVALIQLEMLHDGFSPLTDITVVTDASQVPADARIVLDLSALYATLR